MKPTTLSNLKGLKTAVNAARTALPAAEGPYLEVSVDDVVSTAQVRKKFKNIDQLAASMKAEGQQSPIIVSPKNADGKYVIQKGERRWRAAKVAQLSKIKILIAKAPETELDKNAGELIENMQREDLTLLEIAEGLRPFFEAEWSVRQIADRIGISKSRVGVYKQALEMPDEMRELVEKGVINSADVVSDLMSLAKVDAKALNSGLRKGKERGLISPADSRAMLQQAKQKVTEQQQESSEKRSSKEAAKAPGTNSGATVDGADSIPDATVQLLAKVSFMSGKKKCLGTIVLNRKPTEGNAWIDAEEGLVEVPLSNVTLVAIEPIDE